MLIAIVVIASLGVAYANGANDNFKGVATLFGSGTTNYRRALAWATATTLAGSVTALFLAGKLIKSFGGKGLVEDAIAVEPPIGAVHHHHRLPVVAICPSTIGIYERRLPVCRKRDCRSRSCTLLRHRD